MATTNFTSGTVIASDWLNDVDAVVYGTGSSTGSLEASQVSYIPSGTGAVATTVQTKLRESVSVLDFGAVADGSGITGTDNTTYFQNALNSGATLVRAPYGNYLIDTISIPSGVELDLRGATLLFKAHTTSHNPMIRMGNSTAGVTQIGRAHV